MKFQNPSLNFFLDGRTDGRCTDKPKPICSPLFQSWGHKDNLFKFYPRQLGLSFSVNISLLTFTA